MNQDVVPRTAVENWSLPCTAHGVGLLNKLKRPCFKQQNQATNTFVLFRWDVFVGFLFCFFLYTQFINVVIFLPMNLVQDIVAANTKWNFTNLKSIRRLSPLQPSQVSAL